MGAGFKDCNAAIQEANGDLEKAVEILELRVFQKLLKKCQEKLKRLLQ